jgi:uncharacterized iron-regulated membrane protein
MTLPQHLVKNALQSHSWLGLMASALMYIICLTGTLLVFHAELEQWEQASAPNAANLNLLAAEKTFNEFIARGEGVTPHMYLVLPKADSPVARIATETNSWFLTESGELGPEEANHWSELLLDLHLYLHLPESWGMIFVSALGAVLVGLIISGFLAHPGLLRDAFRLRQRSNAQLSETDLHNRLSVWGAPFHLTIAITGAYFGLALPLLAIVAEAEFAGEREQVVTAVFGEEPAMQPASGYIEINNAIEQIKVMAPQAVPLNVIVHDAQTEKPLLEIYARHPERLIWGEGYQFTIKGEFIQKAGWSDGSIGQQVLYSIYRLHFGNFDGYLAKFLYLLLGLALTVVAATGTNIWLAKRRKEDGLDDLWAGIVWGTPIALAISGFATIFTNAYLVELFWATLLAAIVVCLFVRNVQVARRWLKISLAFCLLVLLIAHYTTYGAAALSGGALLVNSLVCLCLMVVLLGRDIRQRPAATATQSLSIS